MRKLFRTRKRKVAVALTALALVGASAALAAWFIDGTGPGRGTVGTLAQPTVVHSVAAPNKYLLPGVAGSIEVSVTNPAANPNLVITGFTYDTGTITSSSQATCPASHATMTFAAGAIQPLTPNVTINSGQTLNVSLPNAMQLAAAAPQVCEGVFFTHPNMRLKTQTQ